MPPTRLARGDGAVLALLAVAAGACTAWATAPFGPGASPDAASYVATARSLAEGRGFTTFGPHPYTAWPPLYPLVLALPARLGVDPLEAARWLNAALSALILWIAGRMAFRAIGARVLAWCAVAAIAFSPALRLIGVFAWSEALFVLLTLLTARALCAHARDGRRAQLIPAAAWTSAALLTRYAGVAVVAAGAWSILAASPARARWRDAALFVALAAAPAAIWILRCELAGDHPLGDRYAASASIRDVAAGFSTATSSWLLGWSSGAGQAAPSVAAAAIAAAGAALVLAILVAPLRAEHSPCTPLARIALTYIGLVSVLAATTGFDGWGGRMIAPLAPLVIVTGIAALDRWSTAAGARRRIALITATIACVPLVLGGLEPLQRARAGRLPYSARALGDLEILHALRERPLDGLVFSNDPAALALFARRDAYVLPSLLESPGNGQARAAVQASDASSPWWLAWIGNPDDPTLARELAAAARADLVLQRADGALYRVR